MRESEVVTSFATFFTAYISIGFALKKHIADVTRSKPNSNLRIVLEWPKAFHMYTTYMLLTAKDEYLNLCHKLSFRFLITCLSASVVSWVLFNKTIPVPVLAITFFSIYCMWSSFIEKQQLIIIESIAEKNAASKKHAFTSPLVSFFSAFRVAIPIFFLILNDYEVHTPLTILFIVAFELANSVRLTSSVSDAPDNTLKSYYAFRAFGSFAVAAVALAILLR